MNWRKWVKPLADKIVYASDAYVRVKSTVNDFSSQLIAFTEPPRSALDRELLRLVSSLIPEEADGLKLIRIGAAGDGGYVMHDAFGATTALSFGVGRDISWDKAVASRGVTVHAFDHTVRGLPDAVPGVEFHRLGLGSDRNCLPLKIHIDRTCSSGDILLKVDIEGGEWDSLINEDLSRFSQMIIEFHELGQAMMRESSQAFLERVGKSHAPVHVHANNYDSAFRADRYWFASTVEVTFVRRDILMNWRRSTSLREDLDYPCDPRVAEISLAGILGIQPGGG